MVGQGLDDDADIGTAQLQAENRGAAHAVQRLENDVAVLGQKTPYLLRLGGDQRRRGALGEIRGKQLFIGVAQAPGAVDDQQPLGFGQLQQVGAENIVHVKGRILAH